MKLKYWTNFSKRKNSTKQPTSGTEIDVNVKEDGSILNPSFLCSSIPKDATYFYIDDYKRYYFSSDNLLPDNSNKRFNMKCDVLASHKSEIAATKALVKFTSASSKLTIPDGRNVPTDNILSTYTTIGTLPTFTDSAACFICGVASNEGLQYYMMDETAFTNFLAVCFNGTLTGQLYNQIWDLKNILVSCVAMPRYALNGTDSIVVGDPNGISVTLATGLYKIDPVDRMVQIFEDTVDVDYPLDSLGLGVNYFDASPYTTGILFLPFVGCVEFDCGALVSQKSLYVKAILDQITGEIVYSIGMSADKILATYSGCAATNVPVSGSSYNATGVIGAGITAIGGIATLVAAAATEGSSAMIMGGLGAIAGAGLTAVNSLSHRTQVNGSLSSYISAMLGLKIKALIVTREPANTDIDAYKDIYGMPYFEVSNISALSGYVQCQGASASINGFDSERDEINGYLNSGFYYE